MPKQSVQFPAIVKLNVGLPGQGGNLHPSVEDSNRNAKPTSNLNLENRCALTSTVDSNPTLSAISAFNESLYDLCCPQGRKAFIVIAEFVQQLSCMLTKAGCRVYWRWLIAFYRCVDSPVGAVAF